MLLSIAYNFALYGLILSIVVYQLCRAVRQIKDWRFYTSQGKEANLYVCPWMVPSFGSLFAFVATNIKTWRRGSIEHPIGVLVKENCPMTPCNFLMGSCDEPGVIICDVRVVEAMYTTKNKYFDKHYMVQAFLYPLMGESILLAPTSQEWKKSRQVLAPSFYKGKLVQMVDLAKISMQTTLARFRQLAKEGGPRTTVDMVTEVSMMQVRILLMCALGEDVSERELDYWIKGKLEKRCVSYSLRESFHLCMNRLFSPHCFFIGYYAARSFVTPEERDLLANCLILRQFISDIVEKRRADLIKNPELANEGDFLTILLTEPHFKDDNSRIIDECLTFFFAGSQTSACATQNLFCSLLKHPEYQTRLREELENKIIQPHL